MKRAILFVPLLLLLFAAPALAQGPDYYLNIPPGWSEKYDGLYRYQLLESIVPDGEAGVYVFMSDKKEESDPVVYSNLFDALLRATEMFTHVRLLREVPGRMRTGEMKVRREYAAQIGGFSVHLFTLFSGRQGHMFLVAGFYTSDKGRSHQWDVKDCLNSFGFAN